MFQVGGVVRDDGDAGVLVGDNQQLAQTEHLRLDRRRRSAVVLRVLARESSLLRHEGERLQRAVESDDGDGQRLEERRRDDPEADSDLQSHPTGRHHQGADRDHLWRRGALGSNFSPLFKSSVLIK